MANGDYFGVDRLRELIKPVEAIRAAIEKLVHEMNLDVTFHPKGWPGIRLKWVNNNDITCIVTLTMKDDYSLYGLAIAAHRDVEGKRYITMRHIDNELKIPFVTESIIEKIKQAITLCNTIRFEDLALSDYDKKQQKDNRQH